MNGEENKILIPSERSAITTIENDDGHNGGHFGPGLCASQNVGNIPVNSGNTNNPSAGPSTSTQTTYPAHPTIHHEDSPPHIPVFLRDEFSDDEGEIPLFAQQPTPCLNMRDAQLLEALAQSSSNVYLITNPLQFFVTNIIPHMRVHSDEDGSGFRFDLPPEVGAAALHALIQQTYNTNRDSHSL